MALFGQRRLCSLLSGCTLCSIYTCDEHFDKQFVAILKSGRKVGIDIPFVEYVNAVARIEFRILYRKVGRRRTLLFVEQFSSHV